MWGVAYQCGAAGVPTSSEGSQSLANPMGFTVTRPFDSLDAEENRNQARGAEVCWVRKLLRRGYDAAPVEDLHFNGAAGIIPVSRIAAENGVGTEARPIALG